jgi:hypothetical protein
VSTLILANLFDSHFLYKQPSITIESAAIFNRNFFLNFLT